jgi:hypothetical protein
MPKNKLTFGQLRVGTKFRYLELNTTYMKIQYHECKYGKLTAVDLNNGMLVQFDGDEIVEIEE